MIPDNLRRTLLFASALQLLGAEHEVARRLEAAVQQPDAADLAAAEAAIENLGESERLALLVRLEELCDQLPSEALAA